ncbi:TolC family protein [Planctomycetota bacterium]
MDLIALANQSSPDVASARARIRIADAALAGAQAEYRPRFIVSENYGVTDNPVQAFSYQLNQAQLSFAQDFNDPATIDDFHTQLRLQQGIYTGGLRAEDEAAAAFGRTATCQDLRALRNQLAFRVARAYYRLLQARDLTIVRTEAVEQVESHLEVVQTRVRAETAVESDELSVLVRLAEAKEALIRAKNDSELAWALINNVVGMQVERSPLPTVIPSTPWAEDVDELQIAIAEAVGARPEVFSLGSRQSAAAAKIRAARAGKRSKVDFIGDYDVHTSDFSNGNDSFFFGVLASLALFDGGRTDSAVAQAAGRLRELRAQCRRLTLDIELDVRRAWLELNSAEERLEVTDKAVRQAEESLRMVEVQYRGGAATITRLIDAQVALSNARVRRTNAQADIEIARTDLARAMGRLTQVVSP